MDKLSKLIDWVKQEDGREISISNSIWNKMNSKSAVRITIASSGHRRSDTITAKLVQGLSIDMTEEELKDRNAVDIIENKYKKKEREEEKKYVKKIINDRGMSLKELEILNKYKELIPN